MTQSHPGQIPAGMLRIHQGNQEHYVWPVHLPGWLLLGWRVAGSGTDRQDEPLPQVLAAPPVAPDPDPEVTAIQIGPEPVVSRGKRGRRRKEEEHPQTVETSPAAISTAAEDEEEPPTTAVETTPAAIGIAAEESNAASDPSAASEPTDSRSSTELAAESAAEPVDDSTAEGAVALSALPDDLFDDPLI